MKKTFQKTLIAVAAGAALMSAVGTASANSLLFPFFTTNAGAQSVLSLSSNQLAGGGAGGKETLHYVYNYGPSCVHYDGNGSMTANDLMQHSIASAAAGGFGKAVSIDASTPFYFPQSNSYGFLAVTNKTTVGTIISGEMTIVDPSTGMVASYAGLTNGLETAGAGNAMNEGNFAYGFNNYNLSFYGSAVATTNWYTVVLGNMNAAIAANRNWTAAVTVGNNGLVYNNDEVPYSGTAGKLVQCSGNIAPSDLMTSAQQAAVGTNGGLVHGTGAPVPVGGAVLDAATGMYMLKMQTVQAGVGAPFAGKQFLHIDASNVF